MRALTRWFIENPVAANLVMIMIFVAGIITAMTMRIEGFPKVPADTVTIQTLYPEMYASQVDETVTQKIEKAFEGLNGVKKLHAVSRDELSIVSVQKNSDHSLQQLLDDVRLRLAAMASLPQGAEKPVISKNDFDLAAINVQVFGDIETDTLRRAALQVRKTLLEQPEISKIKDWGKRDQELSIEINPERLQKYNLSMQEVVQKIRESSLRTTGGVLRTQGGNINVRSDSQAYFLRDFSNIVVLEDAEGSQLLLSEIAEIKYGYVESDIKARFNGTETIGMEILTDRKGNLLEIVPVVEEVLENIRPSLPSGVRVETWADSSQYISDRLELLKSNALQGLLLVFILLAIFLNLKLAFWVAMGIPVAVFGAIAVMGTSLVDYSINDLTTFGFIVALGIIVDDAVVVGESVHSERQKGGDSIEATDVGVHRVAVATVFGVLTTIAAFLPLMLIDNQLGKVLASFSGVVILALLFSLLESKFVLPAHLAHSNIRETTPRNMLEKFWLELQVFFQSGLDKFKDKLYKPLLAWSLRYRYVVIVGFLTVAMVSVMILNKGFVRTAFFPEIPGQILSINIEMDDRAPISLTNQHATRVENLVSHLNRKLQSSHKLEQKPIHQLLVVVEGAQKLTLIAELSPVSERPGVDAKFLARYVEEKLGTLEGSVSQVVTFVEAFSEGFAIDVSGEHLDQVEEVSQIIKQKLNETKGVSSVRDSLIGGKPEIRLTLKPEAIHFGMTMELLASQVGVRFNGMEVQRIQREQQEVRVMLRGTRSSRDSLADLLGSKVQNRNGNWLPLHTVANIESRYGANFIERRNRKRVNTIKANINKTVVSPTEVMTLLQSSVLEDVKLRYPHISVKGVGELEEIGQLKSGMVKALILITVLIYALLAIPLKSYVQPIIILMVVPFGIIGAVLGHWIMDLPLSLLSFFGMLALTGIIVNDSLVLMTRYNQNRAEGKTTTDALIQAGLTRLRAIFLTTVTTVAGLTPLMFETSEQALYLIPAAVSLAFGELFGTLLTLILIPVAIHIFQDIKKWRDGTFGTQNSTVDR